MPKQIVLLFLGLAVIAFAGLSFIPLLSEIFQNAPIQADQASPTVSASPSSDIEQKQLQELEQGYKAVLEREPENQFALKSLLDTRIKLFSLGIRPVQALIEPLERLVQLNPTNIDYQLSLAQTYQQSDQPTIAAETYRKILVIQPSNTSALQGYVTLLLQEKQPETARTLLETVLNSPSQPANIDRIAINLLLSQVYLSEQEYDQALDRIDQQLQAAPQDYRPLRAKAIVLRHQGQTEAAADLLQQAIDLAPASAKSQLRQEHAAIVTREEPSPPTQPSSTDNQ